jgi:protein gp37
MGATTSIGWTDATFNPWQGCAKVSEGCRNCYAETFVVNRTGRRLWGLMAPRHIVTSTWGDPLAWNRKAQKEGQRRRVFCASHADVFEDRPELAAPRARLFRLIEQTSWLDWLLLTKRPEAVVRLAAEAGWTGAWPSNTWAGCTVENQQRAEERIWRLLGVPARIRFLSCEPLLGPLDLANVRLPGWHAVNGFPEPRGAFARWQEKPMRAKLREGIDWVICGGESGGQARPFDLAWARSLRDQCQAAGVAFFFKQLGDNPILSPGPITWPSKTPKGEDPAEWPEDLRVQQFPEALHAA